MRSRFIQGGRVNGAFSRLAALLCSAFLAAALTPAAQAQTVSDMRVSIVDDLSIVQVEDLDFGSIIGTAAGTVAMTASATPSCTPSAGLLHVQECQPAEFAGKGTDKQIVRIKKPTADKITLTGPGADMLITQLVLDGASELTLIKATPGYSRYKINSASGFFTFWLAGTLNVGANQTPGVYTGTFDIHINYD